MKNMLVVAWEFYRFPATDNQDDCFMALGVPCVVIL